MTSELAEVSELAEIGFAGVRWVQSSVLPLDGARLITARIGELEGPNGYGVISGTAGCLPVLRLAELEPGWDDAVTGILAALRASGIPHRLRPGFWDNVGQCCGTAGSGRTGARPLPGDWGRAVAGLGRRAGGRCHDLRHLDTGRHVLVKRRVTRRADGSPTAARLPASSRRGRGLLRLGRVRRDGVEAVRLPWPDRT